MTPCQRKHFSLYAGTHREAQGTDFGSDGVETIDRTIRRDGAQEKLGLSAERGVIRQRTRIQR